MPARSTVLRLPREVRAELEEQIIGLGFAGYAGLSARLKEMGHLISESALQRHGRNLRAELAPEMRRIRVSTEKAKVLLEELRAGEGVSLKTDTALALIQERIFEAVLDGATEEEVEPLRVAAKAAADTARAQATVSKERRATLRAAADEAGQEATKRGLSPEGVAAIRAAVEGAPP